MLLKFFTNSHATAYLRGMAEEFGESTNAIRHELNNLSRAGYLRSSEEGRTILYRANTDHPLFNEIKNLVHKHLGFDTIIENILSKLGELKAAFIIGDYAIGRDTGTIHLVLIGAINEKYLNKLIRKAKDVLQRDIKIDIISLEAYEKNKNDFAASLLVWKEV